MLLVNQKKFFFHLFAAAKISSCSLISSRMCLIFICKLQTLPDVGYMYIKAERIGIVKSPRSIEESKNFLFTSYSYRYKHKELLS